MGDEAMEVIGEGANRAGTEVRTGHMGNRSGRPHAWLSRSRTCVRFRADDRRAAASRPDPSIKRLAAKASASRAGVSSCPRQRRPPVGIPTDQRRPRRPIASSRRRIPSSPEMKRPAPQPKERPPGAGPRPLAAAAIARTLADPRTEERHGGGGRDRPGVRAGER